MTSSNFIVRMVAGTALSACLLGTSLAAQRHQPLPDATVQSVDGTEGTLVSAAREGQWLILYIGGPDSMPSARLLEALTKWEMGSALARIVVIVESGQDARQMAAAWSDRLPGVQWLADTKGEAARGLKVRGAPTVMGVKAQSLEWMLAGVLNDPAMLRDVIRSWIGQP